MPMLTPSQRDTAVLVSKGMTNREIAERLCLSPGTVRNYVSACLAELELTNRAQLTAWAIRNGLERNIVSAPYDPDDYREPLLIYA